MKTIVSDSVPDSTYFRTGDVEPVIDGENIMLTEGHGSRRSWGAPQANNTPSQARRGRGGSTRKGGWEGRPHSRSQTVRALYPPK